MIDIISVIYLLVGIVGFIGAFFAISIVRILIKHKRDNAPLTIFMLNPTESQKNIMLFRYPAIMLLLTGIATIMQRFVGTPALNNSVFAVFFYLSYIFGLVTILVFVFVIYSWYRQMKRFA